MAYACKNAYGQQLRSGCPKALRTKVPLLAGRMAAQWSPPTVTWQRVEGKWPRSTTQRGEWQGARIMWGDWSPKTPAKSDENRKDRPAG